MSVRVPSTPVRGAHVPVRARHLSVLAGLVVATLVAAPAAAQPAPWQPERLTAGWTFTPAMVVGILRDSNVTLRNEGAPRLSEWVGLLNPRGEIDFNGRRTRFSAGYSGSLEAYREFDELNRYEQRARLGLRQDLTPRANIAGRASYSVSPTTDRLEVDGLPFVDVGSRAFNASADLQSRVSPRGSFSASYSFQQVDFDRETSQGPLQPLTSGYAHSPSASYAYTVAPRVSINAGWSYTHASIDEFRGEFDVQSMMGGVSFRASEHTTLSAGAGVAYLNVERNGGSSWGPAVRGGIEHQVGQTSLSANYERSYVPSYGFGGLSANQRVSGGAKVPFGGGRGHVGASLAFSRNEPVDAIATSYGIRSLWLNGVVGYQMAPWLRAEGFVTSSHQTTDIQGNIDRVRVGVQFVTSKPLRMQ